MYKAAVMALLMGITICLGAETGMPLKAHREIIHKYSLRMSCYDPGSGKVIQLLVKKSRKTGIINQFSLKVAGVDYAIRKCVLKEMKNARMDAVTIFSGYRGYELMIKVTLIPDPEDNLATKDIYIKVILKDAISYTLTTTTTLGQWSSTDLQCGG